MPESDSGAGRWFETVTGSRVERSEALLGGLSSRVERHWLDDGTSVVTRTITDVTWLTNEPDLIEREARALAILAGSAVKAPRLVSSDQPSAHLAMSFLDGEMVTERDDLSARVSAMAEVAAIIAAVPLPDSHGLPPWRPWVPADPRVPTWGDPALWRRAIEAYVAGNEPLAPEPCLLHRDLHPLNMLWSDHVLPAVVDWVNACVGHPHAELGHLRWNLTVLAGLDVADEVLRHYLEVAPNLEPYDTWWDLAPVMSFLPGPIGVSGWHAVGRTDLTHDVVVERTHEFLESALDRI